jgi:hypothetical protein
MRIELDHLFVCASPGAPEAEKLVEFGLQEGPPNQHPGQGTANRRFSFANAMINSKTRLLHKAVPVESRVCPLAKLSISAEPPVCKIGYVLDAQHRCRSAAELNFSGLSSDF